jgi:hypothetical protein
MTKSVVKIAQFSSACVLLAFLIFALQGCDSFLEESPKGQLNPESFYQTPSDAETAVTGVYNALRDAGEGRPSIVMTGVGSDDYYFAKGGYPPRIDISFFRHTPSNANVASNWENHYQLINRANAAAARIPDVEMEADLKNRLIGEVRFLRAWAYFKLVRWFGRVPLLTDATINLQDLEVPRSSVDSVYNQILKDLEFARTNLERRGNVEEGKATVGAANAYLARVYLTRAPTEAAQDGDYQRAADAARRVMESGDYALFKKYYKNFTPKYENGIEHVFSIQATVNSGNSSLPAGFLPRVNGALGPYGGRTYQNFSITESLYNAFEEGDKRGRQSVVWKDSIIVNGEMTAMQRPPNFGPNIWTNKYVDSTASPNNSGVNAPIMRYADVLLMYAEAANEANGGPTEAAYDAIDQVRQRAGLAELPSGLNQQAFRKAVWHERRVELYAEGHRWFDLVRTGRLEERVEAAKPQADVELPKHLLYPIPSQEIDVNSSLDQNPGY